MYSRPLQEVLNAEVEVDDVALISIDSKGADIRVRQGAQVTISFAVSLLTLGLYTMYILLPARTLEKFSFNAFTYCVGSEELSSISQTLSPLEET